MKPLPSLRRRIPILVLSLLALADLGWVLIRLPALTRAHRHPAGELPAEGRPAVILGSGVERNGEPGPILEGRLRVALALYRTGRVRWLLVTGFDQEPVVMRRWLLAQGVPAAAIVADPGARRTYESLQRARTLFGLERVVVVTSDFHLPRALWLAGHLGLEADGVAASTDELPLPLRERVRLRELGAVQRALVDVGFPPRSTPRGPRERTPDE